MYVIIIIVIIIILIRYFTKSIKYTNCNKDLYIISNFYCLDSFKSINKYCKNLKYKDDYRITSRKTICLKYKDHPILYNLIYNKKLKKFIKYISNKDLKIPSFPIEYRIYPKKSIGMKMHKDIALYENTYYECVLTLVNKSNSKFKYICNNNTKILNSLPNTLMLVTPKTITHGVSATDDGYRTILKFVVTFNNNLKNENYYSNYNLCPF
jgi:hypothetical protein